MRVIITIAGACHKVIKNKTGIYKFPKDLDAKIAINAVAEYLLINIDFF